MLFVCLLLAGCCARSRACVFLAVVFAVNVCSRLVVAVLVVVETVVVVNVFEGPMPRWSLWFNVDPVLVPPPP